MRKKDLTVPSVFGVFSAIIREMSQVVWFIYVQSSTPLEIPSKFIDHIGIPQFSRIFRDS